MPATISPVIEVTLYIFSLFYLLWAGLAALTWIVEEVNRTRANRTSRHRHASPPTSPRNVIVHPLLRTEVYNDQPGE